MEDYFHLNLKKFVAESNRQGDDVKPNPAKLPEKPAEAVSDQQNFERVPLRAAIDNTDPYNSTGRFNLKTADG